ncbi:MAG: DUF3857 domain-containing protein [Myxococcales bacterium]|nr:DUF3857 domain-containing protein [Myxococcales bacterium]
MLALRLAPVLVALGLAAAQARPTDHARAEADRLIAQAAARGAEAGGAVDLMRLAELDPWAPAGAIPRALRDAADDPKRAPLVRAVAWWLLRDLARERLDVATADAARAALGLLGGFVWRVGAAPHPTAPLAEGEGWRPFPDALGGGELWLDAVVRPERDAVATLATRLDSPSGGPAVLRLGYDDAVTVWLNGDEVYVAPADHPAWLDQAAIPVVLRAGANRLVVEVRQRTGAWRLIARVTDAAGAPLPITGHPDPWGPPPEPAPGEPPAAVAHLWRDLAAAADTEPPDAQGLRDLADYARVTGLPDRDQSTPRVAIEGAWITDPGPRTLLAWLRLLPEDEGAPVRAAHPPTRPVNQADVFADLHLALRAGWAHYYARRHRETRRTVETLLGRDPGFLPAWRLAAVLREDLNLPHSAVALLDRAVADWPDRTGLRRARLAALQSAGRVIEALATLRTFVDEGVADAGDRVHLADLLATRGDHGEALALLDGVTAARPELRAAALEAAELLRLAGEPEAALERLEVLAAQTPGDAATAERRVEVLRALGRDGDAVDVVDAALAVQAGDPALRALRDSLAETAEPPPLLGPPLAELVRTPLAPGAPAQVLYHHARTEVDARGRAVRRVRRVLRLLSDEGARRYGQMEIAYVPGEQQLRIEVARRVRPGAPDQRPARSDRDLSDPDYRLYYDLRAEVLTFARPQPGDVIEVAWTLADADHHAAFPDYFGELAYLQEAIPRARTLIEVAGPAAEGLHVGVVAPGLDVRRSPGRVEAVDVPASPVEPDMPGPSSVRAYVHLSTADGWAEIDRRYRALLDGRDRPTEALAEQARAWAGDATEPAEVVRRLYAAVADRTRYVALEFGVRSYKPEHPAVTLARGYGDCKDKATLLVALLRAVGVEAHLTLVRTRNAGDIAPLPASFALFDHAIVYVPALDRFVDPTVDRNDPDTLPPSDQGAQALVVGVDTALRTLPVQPADTHLLAWDLQVAPTETGDLVGTLRLTTRGQPASVVRRQLEAGGTRRERAEQIVARRFPGVSLADVEVTGASPAFDPVEVTARVRLPAPGGGGGLDLPLTGAPWRLVSRFADAADRRAPLALAFTRHERLRLAITDVTPAEALPPPVDLDSAFGRLSARASASSAGVEIVVDHTITALTVPAADYGAFRAWLARADAALDRRLRLRTDRGVR